MDSWHNIFITDKTGVKFFNTVASPMSTDSEIKNLMRHLNAIKENQKYLPSIDSKTAILMLDNTQFQSIDDIMNDDLLLELLG